MSHVVIDEAKAELRSADQDILKLRKSIGEFEKDLNAIAAGIPQAIKANDPAFARHFASLQKLRDELAKLKEAMKGHAKSLARSQAAVQAAEKAISAELA